MKKILLFISILILTNCGVKTTESFPLPENSNPSVTIESLSLGEFSTQAEGAFGFLWPQDLNSTSTFLLAKIINSAKILQQTNFEFRAENERIKIASKKFHCLCIREGLCEVEEDPLSFPDEFVLACEKLESDKLENDKKLALTFQNRELLKKAVEDAGGFWLASKSNPEPGLKVFLTESRFDFSDLQFLAPLENPIEISNGDSSQTSGSFKRTTSGSLVWEGQQAQTNWKLDLIENDNFFSFQGDFFVTHFGKKQRGVLGFQLIRN